jgi:hypothetical protein
MIILKRSIKNSMRITAIIWIMASLLLACNKHKDEWWIKGEVKDALDGTKMSNISVKAEVKKLVSGVYNDIITTASEDVTDGSGSYEMIWKRENISYCRIVASKSNYFDAIVEVSPDDMKPGEAFNQNLSLTPRSDLQIHIGSTDPSALVKLAVFSDDPYCTCNDDGEYAFTGLMDTTFQCMAAGGQWLKYQIQAFGSNGNVYHLDSIYCEPFVISTIQYVY